MGGTMLFAGKGRSSGGRDAWYAAAALSFGLILLLLAFAAAFSETTFAWALLVMSLVSGAFGFALVVAAARQHRGTIVGAETRSVASADTPGAAESMVRTVSVWTRVGVVMSGVGALGMLFGFLGSATVEGAGAWLFQFFVGCVTAGPLLVVGGNAGSAILRSLHRRGLRGVAVSLGVVAWIFLVWLLWLAALGGVPGITVMAVMGIGVARWLRAREQRDSG